MPIRFAAVVGLVFLSVALTATSGEAHGGRLDLFGCNHHPKHGDYHCHQGQLAGQQFASQEDMLRLLEPGRKEVVAQEPEALPRQTATGETCIHEHRTGSVVCGVLVP